MHIFQGSVMNNFLCQNGQQYKIPVYQRNYEWSREQCDMLFNDIVVAAKNNKLHFCGSIVFQPMMPIHGINNHIIIDGQQRLTTIYILIKALADMALNEAERMIPESALFNTDQFNQLHLDNTTKVKLKPAKDNNDQLMNLLYDKHDEIDKDCEIYRNYVHFCELIKKEQEVGINVSDIYRGLSMLTVAVIQLDNSDNAQEIFERINSTGIPLSLADKIRNYVLMTDIDQDRLYEEYWLKIENLLDKKTLEDFFLDYLNLKLDGFAKESEAYDEFKTLYVMQNYTNESMLQEIYHYACLYHVFLYGSSKLSEQSNNYLRGIRKLKQTTVFLFLFRVFDDCQKEVIDETTLQKVLQLLLSYSIRRLMCEISSNSLRGLYKTLYGRVFNNEENKKNYYDSIVSFLLQLTSRDVIPSDNTFKTALKENNLYRKNALCKYLLVAIENEGKEPLVVKELSIEHIMPQNKNLSKEWKQMLGENWELVHEKWLHTLGNLALTGYNTELGDKPFKRKIEMLKEQNTHITVLYKDVFDCEEWNYNTINDRADALADKVISLFPIVKPEKEIQFLDPRYKEYTLADPSEATFKAVNYYELLGERVNVNSFASMLKSVVQKLYDMDSAIIEDMAKKNEVFHGWMNPVFSYDKDKVKYAFQIDNSDVYMSIGYSAYDTVCYLRALLKCYDLDIEEDFVYSARNNKKEE